MLHIHIIRKIIPLLCLIFFTKCTSNINLSQEKTRILLADRNTLLMKGYTTSFADGYIDGCQSGQYAAGDQLSHHVKDLDRAGLEQDYSVGWVQGNSFCKKHMQDLINNNGFATYQSQEAMEQEKQRMWSELKK